jgi:3-methyladenine DNA glycosylase AlkD
MVEVMPQGPLLHFTSGSGYNRGLPPIQPALPQIVQLVRRELQAVAVPARVAAMQAYMKSSEPCLGVAAVPLRAGCRRAFAAVTLANPAAWRTLVLQLWRGAAFREERYAAIELAADRRARGFQNIDALPMYEEMIVTGAWWDLVDGIATRRLGEIMIADPRPMRKAMLEWSRSDNIWKRRGAILCQLHFKSDTDMALQHRIMEPNLESKEFFIAKAIGWALRHYARTDPDAVRRYVAENGARMQPLSRREALKHL